MACFTPFSFKRHLDKRAPGRLGQFESLTMSREQALEVWPVVREFPANAIRISNLRFYWNRSLGFEKQDSAFRFAQHCFGDTSH